MILKNIEYDILVQTYGMDRDQLDKLKNLTVKRYEVKGNTVPLNIKPHGKLNSLLCGFCHL